MRGRIKFLNAAKGYAFVTPDDGGPDVFVHLGALDADAMRPGARVVLSERAAGSHAAAGGEDDEGPSTGSTHPEDGDPPRLKLRGGVGRSVVLRQARLRAAQAIPPEAVEAALATAEGGRPGEDATAALLLSVTASHAQRTEKALRLSMKRVEANRAEIAAILDSLPPLDDGDGGRARGLDR